jgi:hypothetical protein
MITIRMASVLMGGLQSDENDHQAHGLHDRATVLIRDAAPEKKPEETAGDNGQSIYNGTQHKNRRSSMQQMDGPQHTGTSGPVM